MTDLARVAVSIGAAALFAGCSGAQPPIGAPAEMPQSYSIAEHASRGESWMLPEAKNDDLLYISTVYANQGVTYIYSYPKGTLVGELTVQNWQPQRMCTDSSGDVFIPYYNFDDFSSYVYEYAHGGTTPIAELVTDGTPESCAFDASTGNLAVTDQQATLLGNLAIYAHAQGSPTLYYPSNMFYVFDCTYDDSGDVYVDGSEGDSGELALAELSKGSNTVTNISINDILFVPQAIQWVAPYLTLQLERQRHERRQYIEQLSVSGSEAEVVNSIALDKSKTLGSQYLIVGGKVIEQAGKTERYVGEWRYPTGGKLLRKLTEVGTWVTGIALSTAHNSR